MSTEVATVLPSSPAATHKQSNFLDIPGCNFSETSLRIRTRLSFNHWQRLGEILKRAETGIQWWLGDWMAYGEKQYGEKYAQAIAAHEATGINIDTLRNYQWVAEHVKVVMRITSLPWSFHQIVASLPEAEQIYWLNKALERKEQGNPYTFRELKREVEKAERAKNFQLETTILNRIWDRIEDGCYTPEAVMKCSECGKDIFGLDVDEIKLYMEQLVKSGKAVFRKQGGKTDMASGLPFTLCVPADLPAGSSYEAYHPIIEFVDDDE